MILALQIVALILFILASATLPTGRVQLGWLGLAFFMLSLLWGKF